MIFFLRFPWILLLFFIEHHRSLSDAAPTTSIVNCDEYVNDFDVIQRFPFSVIVDPEEPFQSLFTSTVITYPNDNQSIQELTIREQDVVPPSFVCLRNLRELTVADTPFYQSSFVFVSSSIFVNVNHLNFRNRSRSNCRNEKTRIFVH